MIFFKKILSRKSGNTVVVVEGGGVSSVACLFMLFFHARCVFLFASKLYCSWSGLR